MSMGQIIDKVHNKMNIIISWVSHSDRWVNRVKLHSVTHLLKIGVDKNKCPAYLYNDLKFELNQSQSRYKIRMLFT